MSNIISRFAYIPKNNFQHLNFDKYTEIWRMHLQFTKCSRFELMEILFVVWLPWQPNQMNWQTPIKNHIERQGGALRRYIWAEMSQCLLWHHNGSLWNHKRCLLPVDSDAFLYNLYSSVRGKLTVWPSFSLIYLWQGWWCHPLVTTFELWPLTFEPYSKFTGDDVILASLWLC